MITNHERGSRGTHPDFVGAERNLQRELISQRLITRLPILGPNLLVVWVVLYREATRGKRHGSEDGMMIDDCRAKG